MTIDKRNIIHFIKSLLNDGSLHPDDLNFIIQRNMNHLEPEGLRQELENWYKGLGIEIITGQKFHLSACPFTKEEINKINENNEIILCAPAGVSRQQLGKLFRINCWALEDSLYPEKVRKKDFWFKTLMTFKPSYVNLSAKEIRRIFEDENKLGFSLSLYLIFLTRMKFLIGKWPDQEWWTWLLAYKYDRSGFLITGFDSQGKFSAHGWMSDFRAKFVGARYLTLPEKR